MHRQLSHTWLFTTVFVPLTLCHLSAEEPRTYRIQRTLANITVDGKRDETAWTNAASVGEFQFPWWQQGTKEQTEAKLLWNEQLLYVLFHCEDAHVSGENTERDSPCIQGRLR